MIFKWLQRGLSALGIAALTSCATPVQQAPAAPEPALWKVADADTTIYLFGTIHLLPKDASWETPALRSAMTQSQGLYVETIIDEANPATLRTLLQQLGLSQGLPPIASRVSPDMVPRLEAAIAKSGVPRRFFDQMETWAAGFTLLSVQFQALGLEGEHGVEKVLRDDFKRAGKPIGQLETNEEQLRFFDTLPEEAQRALLEGAIDDPQAMCSQFAGMLEAWLRGDVKAIAKTFNEDMASSPALMNALIRRRNVNWSHWVENRLANPGTVMVAVGAGHLAGEASVQDLLEKRGLKVTRIQ